LDGEIERLTAELAAENEKAVDLAPLEDELTAKDEELAQLTANVERSKRTIITMNRRKGRISLVAPQESSDDSSSEDEEPPQEEEAP
jgi:hypothetical protein